MVLGKTIFKPLSIWCFEADISLFQEWHEGDDLDGTSSSCNPVWWKGIGLYIGDNDMNLIY